MFRASLRSKPDTRVAVVGVGMGRAKAAALSDLTTDTAITVGEVAFSGWQVLPAPDALDLSRIEVVALDDDPAGPGLAIVAQPGALTAQQSDKPLHLFFQLTVTSRAKPISGVSLLLAEYSIDGLAQVRIEESTLRSDGGLLARVKAFDASEGLGGGVQQLDSTEFDPEESLTVNFQITVMGDFAEINLFGTRFLLAD